MAAIALGVAALVATRALRAALTGAVRTEARTLLGADLRLSSSRPFPDSVTAILDSAAAAGVALARVTGTVTVAVAPDGGTRFVQVRAVSPGYPFHGDVVTEPPGLWTSLLDEVTASTAAESGRQVLVEPSLLAELGLAPGDSIRIGLAAFRVAGSLVRPPVELGFRSAIAPRVYMDTASLRAAGLIQFGSLVTYQAYLAIPDPAELQRFVDRNHDTFRRALINFTTAEEEADELTEAFDWITRFLGLIGLSALLLGGLGVASAVNVFVREKRHAIAVLRCLGATRQTAFTTYLLQAAGVALFGATVGAALGLAVQPALLAVLGDALPVETSVRLDGGAVAVGLATGAAVATLFALLPMLQVRGVPPLQALRANVEPPARRFDALRLLAWAALLAGVGLVSVLEAPTPLAGLAFAAALAAGMAMLWALAWLTARAARRWLPRRAGFAVRQGVSGLFRPGNQTAAVTLALGFGVFLITTIWVVQSNLLDRLRPSASAATPDLVAFDIQPDQTDSIAALWREAGLGEPALVPIVPGRILRINDSPVDELLSGPAARTVEPWALRREYRNTWRRDLAETEQLVAGEWWTTAPATAGDTAALSRISVEEDLARSINVGLGDRIAWDFQGIEIETRVASLRRVDWATFQPNFFVVFEPGVIDDAPQTWVTFANVPDPATRAAVQREIAQRLPNSSTLDLSLVRETLAGIVGRFVRAVRFMALFALAAGAIVLTGALAAGRAQRAREAVLLRTLGATRATVRRVLLTEYAALGGVAGLAGTILGLVAGWVLVRFFFELPFRPPLLPLAAIWITVAALAMALGAWSHRSLLRRPPLAALREAV